MWMWLKREAKKTLYVVGLQIQRNPAGFPRWKIHRKGLLRLARKQSSTLGQFLKHITGLGYQPVTVIDVGVGYGTPELYKAFPGARHLLIEPLMEFEGTLQRIAKKYGAEYVIAAATDEPGHVVMNVSQALDTSSLLGSPQQTWTPATAHTRQVRAIQLGDLCQEKRLGGSYLIKGEVQGAELKMLNGAGRILNDTDVVILEVSLFRFLEGVPDFYDVIAYMKGRGFVVYDIFGGSLRPVDGALGQVDIAFVKEGGIFRTTHAYYAV
jgi:FkbM family methyltransferase